MLLPSRYPEEIQMPAKELTAIGVANWKSKANRQEIADSRAKGLYLVIQAKPSKKKSWAWRHRRPNGDTAKLTLGPVDTGAETTDAPVQDGALTLGQARE